MALTAVGDIEAISWTVVRERFSKSKRLGTSEIKRTLHLQLNSIGRATVMTSWLHSTFPISNANAKLTNKDSLAGLGMKLYDERVLLPGLEQEAYI